MVLALTFILSFWALLPFSADLLGTFSLQPLTVDICGFNMTAIWPTQFLLWRHATVGRRLMGASMAAACSRPKAVSRTGLDKRARMEYRPELST